LNNIFISALLAFLIAQPLNHASKAADNNSTYEKDIQVSMQHSRGKSGPLFTEQLMWEKDPKFLTKKEKYKCNVRLAAYKTVLPDPMPGEEYNVGIAADMLACVIIEPEEIFSQNETVGPYTTSRGFKKGPTYSGGNLITTIGGGVCKIASTLYNVVTLSNLKVIERYNHSMMVSYVPLGQDATVYYGSRDLRFQNNTDHPIMIWAKAKDDTLYIAFYGREAPPKVTWHHEILDSQETHNHTRYNDELPKGQKKVVYEGYHGYTVKSWLTIEYKDGKKKTKNLGIDYYKPLPGLIEVGTKE
jgi:vancomycin resistance protein YoaR